MPNRVFIGYFKVNASGVRRVFYRPSVEFPSPPTLSDRLFNTTKQAFTTMIHSMLENNKLFPIDDIENDNPDFSTDMQDLVQGLIDDFEVGKKSDLNISLIGDPGSPGVAALLRIKARSADERLVVADIVLGDAIPPELAAFTVLNANTTTVAGGSFLLAGTPTIVSGTTNNLEYSITATIDDEELEDGIPQPLDHEFDIPFGAEGKTLTVSVHVTNLVGIDTVEGTFVIGPADD